MRYNTDTHPPCQPQCHFRHQRLPLHGRVGHGVLSARSVELKFGTPLRCTRLPSALQSNQWIVELQNQCNALVIVDRLQMTSGTLASATVPKCSPCLTPKFHSLKYFDLWLGWRQSCGCCHLARCTHPL